MDCSPVSISSNVISYSVDGINEFLLYKATCGNNNNQLNNNNNNNNNSNINNNTVTIPPLDVPRIGIVLRSSCLLTITNNNLNNNNNNNNNNNSYLYKGLNQMSAENGTAFLLAPNMTLTVTADTNATDTASVFLCSEKV